jgi:hypothetical protein
MKPKVYIETSIISYLTARLNRDLVIAGHQQITQDWWEFRRKNFGLYISQLVVNEAGRGDREAAEKRLSVLRDIPLLQFNDTVTGFAQKIVSGKIIPEKAAEDAVHIAVATVHKMDYLVTWNCSHIANAELRRKISEFSTECGYEIPIICTPEELMGG